jgi:hypothetical protein
LTDEKLTIDDARILEESNGHLTVDITIRVSVEVFGKGKDYNQTVDVQPNEQMEVLKQKLSFIKIFIQRKHSLFIKPTGGQQERIIEDFTRTFREMDIKDGTQLLMKEQGKVSLRQKHQQ